MGFLTSNKKVHKKVLNNVILVDKIPEVLESVLGLLDDIKIVDVIGSIEELQNRFILYGYSGIRVIIIDSGSGIFTNNMNEIKEIVSILSNEINSEVVVYYSNKDFLNFKGYSEVYKFRGLKYVLNDIKKFYNTGERKVFEVFKINLYKILSLKFSL